jgi:hypothetical protein
MIHGVLRASCTTRSWGIFDCISFGCLWGNTALSEILEIISALRRAHGADYKRLFDRVSLDLGPPGGQSLLPTDERIARFANDRDPALAALYFHYGRYLMIAGSRPGSQPLNLQGIWNHEVIPPWASAFTTNINTEMNYCPTFPSATSRCCAWSGSFR